jgi:hypothetical protein
MASRSIVLFVMVLVATIVAAPALGEGEPTAKVRKAIAAMYFLAYYDALVIDLRNNSGGQPSMIRVLSSYFLEKRTNLGSLYRWRLIHGLWDCR